VKVSNLTLASFIGVSLFLHLFLIWLLNQSSVNSVAIAETFVQAPVSATLIIVPVKRKTIIPANVLPALTPEKIQEVKEAVPQVVPKPVHKPTPKDDAVPLKNEVVTNTSVPVNVQVTPSHGATDIQPSNKPSAQAILSASRRYTNQITDGAPIADPRQATLSSMTATPARHHYKVVTKTPEQKRRINVTCDSGVKKTLAVLAGFAGGTLRCDQGPNLADFMPKKRK